MKKLLILFIILMSSLVIAGPIEISEERVNNQIYPGDIVEFWLNIKNNQNTVDTFIIKPDVFASAPFSDVIEDITVEPNKVTIGAGNAKQVNVKVKLQKEIVPDKLYRTFVRISSLGRPYVNINHFLDIDVVSPDHLIKIKTDLKERIIPGKGLKFNVIMENIVNLILKDIKVNVKSELFEEEFTLKFYPYQVIKKEIDFDIKSDTPPGEYNLEIVAYQDRFIKGKAEEKINVIINPNIQENKETIRRFLVEEIRLTKTNYGNLISEERFVVEISNFKKAFTKFNIQPNKFEDGKIIWVADLKPNESYSIIMRTDYRGVFFGALVIVIGLLIWYYINGRKVRINKSVFKIRDEKGISELKVMLHIKNNNNDVKNIKVMDMLPHLIKPTKQFGTLKPSKIKSSFDRTTLVWEIGELIRGEERIISYTVESKLHIIGKIMLPNALVMYRKGNKTVKEKSNRVILLSMKK